MNKKLRNIHPGEILNEDFLKPMKISPEKLSQQLNLSKDTILEIIHGKKDITSMIAHELSQYFGTTAELWINLQKDYDLECK